jgi:ABC-type lipoprotein release transport system permease subunit
MLFKLALRNLLYSGLKTWLNVLALSLSFVVIILAQGFYDGLKKEIANSTIDLYYGGGQYWVNTYIPYDPLSIEDAHAPIPEQLQELVDNNRACPILIRSAAIYPNHRIQNVLLKGIPADQKVLDLPSSVLTSEGEEIPTLIGNRMAEDSGLKIGDLVTVRWRDNNGTFDAKELKIKEIMRTSVRAVDEGQIWIAFEDLARITGLNNQATMLVLAQNEEFNYKIKNWNFRDLDYLLQDARAFVNADNIGASIFYFILILLAMLSIFDTQVLAIFRRKKEFGTLMAMGMTKRSLIQLITLEGAMYAVLASVVAAIYGIPILIHAKATGFGMPEAVGKYGYAIGNRIYPNFPLWLILTTVISILVITTIVGYLPTRRISKLSPTEALRGK